MYDMVVIAHRRISAQFNAEGIRGLIRFFFEPVSMAFLILTRIIVDAPLNGVANTV